MLAIRSKEKNIRLEYVIDDAVPKTLIGDGGRLRQVLLILAGNAVKFTGQGEVIIQVALKEETNGQAMLHFKISDTGIIILKDKIFSKKKSFQANWIKKITTIIKNIFIYAANFIFYFVKLTTNKKKLADFPHDLKIKINKLINKIFSISTSSHCR